ncbi:MAG: patatin-like phospholipase family protein [Deltaproteobacteria bacterium]|nr:patatin-like phospholipase family protein [Deltaproteobacteria bacterium]
MAYQFKNLIFEGGGVKGVAYAGAIKVLEEKGIMSSIVRVGGTSAGAINAVLVGLGYTSAQTLEIMNKLNFKKFMDDDFGVFRDIDRLLNEFGWHKGAFFRKWISKLIKKKTGNPDATFAEVQKHKKEKGFSHRSPRGDVYVDGGLLDNYPVKLFDRKKYVAQEDLSDHGLETKYYKKHNQQLKRKGLDISPYIYNKETLGFRLDSEREIAVFRDQSEPAQAEITDFSSYSLNLIKTIMDSQANTHLHNDDWQRTIYVDTLGVKTTDFSLTDAKKKALVESGRNGTENYFKWFDSPASKSVNRV